MLEDAKFGEFVELASLHDLSGSDADFKSLLRNEVVSLWGVVWSVLTKAPFWNLILIGVLFFGLRRAKFDQQKAVIAAVGAVLVLNAYEIIAKLLHEEII